MSQPSTISIPLLNPNEPEATIVEIQVIEGQMVAEGDSICTIETTKSTADIKANRDGYVLGLRFQQGQVVNAGDILCYLADSTEWIPPEEILAGKDEVAIPDQKIPAPSDLPAGLRITKPALSLALDNKLDLNVFPSGSLITHRDVLEYLKDFNTGQEGEMMKDFSAPESEFDNSAVVVYGGGGHGKAIIELIRAQRLYRPVGIIDDGIALGEHIMGVPVLGGKNELSSLYEKGIRQIVNAVGGISDSKNRLRIYQLLAEQGFTCPTIIHPTACIEPSSHISLGVQVFPNTYVGSDVQVGYGCLVNTGAIISHEAILGDFANISPGAIIAGAVSIGKGTLVGMGVTINLGVNIGEFSKIGNGATIKGDVPPKGIVRAGTSWPD